MARCVSAASLSRAQSAVACPSSQLSHPSRIQNLTHPTTQHKQTCYNHQKNSSRGYRPEAIRHGMQPKKAYPPLHPRTHITPKTPNPAMVRSAHEKTRTLTLQHPPPPVPRVQFQGLFHSHLKVLFIFASQYLFAIGVQSVFSISGVAPAS